jgi:hypothetical protein
MASSRPVWVRAMRSIRLLASLPVQAKDATHSSGGKVAVSRSA